MKGLLFAILLLAVAAPVRAQETRTTEDKEAAYTKTITARAEKIVARLGISDSLKASRVTRIITDQYRRLNEIYTDRDAKIASLKQSNAPKGFIDSVVKVQEEMSFAKAQKHHPSFIKALSAELTPEQLEGVKDGMTYSVAPITYKAFLDMIPSLQPAQKKQILDWLLEARELAMDAESSEKKHWWFGKYKGRINNYLAAQGYDLQKERKDWEQRQKAGKEQKQASQNQ